MPGHYDAGPGIAPDPQYEEEYKHAPNCSMVVISGCDACDCDTSNAKEEIKEETFEYTLVPSQEEHDLYYIREGDGSHSKQDVAMVILRKDEGSVEGTKFLSFLAMHMKVK